MASQSTKRIRQLNLHLLKSSVSDVKDAIAVGKSPVDLVADVNVLPSGVLYYETPSAKRASWREFLAPGFPATLPAFHAQHASAVLFFKAGSGRRKRTFAATFGYGRALLAESALVADFGLRTALNLCDPETLRAVNYRTIEDRTRISRVQLSDAGAVDAFRMNVDTDLLRGLEAESKNTNVCERLGARWSNLIVAARIIIGDLPKLAADLLSYYRKKSLPEEYAWIDNVRRVTDPSVKDLLDENLEACVKNNDLNNIRLAMPEIAGVTVGIDAKLFKPASDAHDFTSDFAMYLELRKRQVDWRVDTARTSHKVYLIDSSSGNERDHASIYRCIVAELDHGNDRYLLVDGEWFRLNREFVQEVNDAMDKIPVLAHGLPSWNQGEAEGEWNERACQVWDDAALLDKSNIPHGGRWSRIEPADILTIGRLFGHAKRRDKCSSGLSHLFAQGTVAARLICQDTSFRAKVADCIPDSHESIAAQLGDDYDPRHWTIGFVLLGSNVGDPAGTLPFFSKVNFKGAIEQLRLMGYKVGVIGV